jgi:hypothetical protein
MGAKCKALYQLKRKVGMKWLMNWQSCSRVCAHSLERLQGVQQYHVKPVNNNNNNIISLEGKCKGFVLKEEEEERGRAPYSSRGHR